MNKKLNEAIKELKKEINLKDKVYVRTVNYKKKTASASIDKNIVRIDKKILEDEKFLKKVLKHELLHIKFKTRWHTPEFFE